MIELFERYPDLESHLPYKELGRLPTRLDCYQGRDLGISCEHLLVKRDDKSGVLYGGNKVRKLEFLLADALRQDCQGVITFGTAGSNHALATAVYARQCDLICYSMLSPQPVSSAVRRNLLAGYGIGNRLMGYESYEDSVAGARALLKEASERGVRLYRVRGGGSSPLGCVGFVNAALELRRQIDEQDLPAPDVIYVPLGTMGTVTGLMIGLQAADIDCPVVAVRVVAEEVANEPRYRVLYRETAELLNDGNAGFPVTAESIREPDVRHEHFGPGYGHFTAEGMRAVGFARDALGIGLEGTYTGKTFAALMKDLESQKLAGKSVLFWNTYNSMPLPEIDGLLDYQALPPFFHGFFEQPLQDLDPETE